MPMEIAQARMCAGNPSLVVVRSLKIIFFQIGGVRRIADTGPGQIKKKAHVEFVVSRSGVDNCRLKNESVACCQRDGRIFQLESRVVHESNQDTQRQLLSTFFRFFVVVEVEILLFTSDVTRHDVGVAKRATSKKRFLLQSLDESLAQDRVVW